MSNPNGVVEDYILYLLNDICNITHKMIIVINGSLRDNEKNKLYTFTNEIIFRNNEGYDAGAYKDVILNYVSLSEIKKYDELVLCNDTFFGPFIPFEKIFKYMEDKRVDFWGLTKHADFHNEQFQMPEHIQSYFLVVRHSMLCNKAFGEYWHSMPEISSFEDLVKNFEVRFTTFFFAKGFNYSAYVEDDELNGIPTKTYNHYAFIPYLLLSKYNMPVLKKKTFIASKFLQLSIGDELTKSIDWIGKNTNYDISMIWQSIISKYNLVELKDALNLNYIIYDNVCENSSIAHHKVAVIAYITNYLHINDTIEYLKLIPKDLQLIIVSNNIAIKDKISLTLSKNINYVIDTKTSYCDAFLEGLRCVEQYCEYVCFIHDKFLNVTIDDYEENRSANVSMWENISLSNISEVVDVFTNNKQIGVLCVPEPLHGIFPIKTNLCWSKNFTLLKQATNNLKLHCVLDISKRFFSYSGAFWVRKCCVTKLLKHQHCHRIVTDEILGYIILCATQDAGFIAGTIYDCNYATLELQNMNIYTRKYFCDMTAINFGKCFKHIFVYGAGKIGKHISLLFEAHKLNIEAFVVSDSHLEKKHLVTGKIVTLNAVPIDDDTALIVALGKRNIYEVESQITAYGCSNVLYYIQ